MGPIIIIVIIVLTLLVILLPSKYVLVVLLFAASYLGASGGIVLGAAHLPPIRILIIVSLIRERLRGNYHIQWNKLDKTFFMYSATLALAYCLRLHTFEALNFIMGLTIDVTGGYIIARLCIRSWDDIVFFLKSYALLMIPYAMEMVFEQITHYNLFSIVGAPVTSYIRSGRYRAQGTYGPILSGTLGAIGAILSIPLLFSFEKHKFKYLVAVLAGITIAIAGATSGAIMALLYGLLALGLWYVRDKMSYIRIGLVLLLIVLSLTMKAPIWYLIAKISDILGGTGWHRAYLIDQAIRYFSNWWLLGISQTGYWMPYELSDGNADITNQYLQQGVTGGIVPMILYIVFIVRGFKYIGIGLRNTSLFSPRIQFIIWGLGCALFAHVATFFSVSYYNNIRVLFYFLLAAIALLESSIISKIPASNRF
jgi:hypothetical protein